MAVQACSEHILGVSRGAGEPDQLAEPVQGAAAALPSAFAGGADARSPLCQLFADRAREPRAHAASEPAATAAPASSSGGGTRGRAGDVRGSAAADPDGSAATGTRRSYSSSGAEPPRPHRRVALVGNAPLNETGDRDGIAGADLVVRFNWMHHRCAECLPSSA